MIKTDHLSLKYLLDQKISTTMKQKWLTKLLGYDYEIVYKSGQENKVADALSRVGINSSLLAVTVVQAEWLTQLKEAWQVDDKAKQIIQDLIADPYSHKSYSWSNGLLTRKGKLVVSPNEVLRSKIMLEVHGNSEGGHSGMEKTYKRLKRSFYWKGLKKDVFTFMATCDTCQRNKNETTASPGLLQPLPIPERIWTDLSMDFIEGLPVSHGKSVIFVVVDRLSKYVHFMALAHPYTALDVAQAFMDTVFKLHGMPTSIVSDRDVVFTSNFWQALFKLQGTTLQLSTAYHPQTDGQTEVVNRCLETYLRCMTGDKP